MTVARRIAKRQDQRVAGTAAVTNGSIERVN